MAKEIDGKYRKRNLTCKFWISVAVDEKKTQLVHNYAEQMSTYVTRGRAGVANLSETKSHNFP